MENRWSFFAFNSFVSPKNSQTLIKHVTQSILITLLSCPWSDWLTCKVLDDSSEFVFHLKFDNNRKFETLQLPSIRKCKWLKTTQNIFFIFSKNKSHARHVVATHHMLLFLFIIFSAPNLWNTENKIINVRFVRNSVSVPFISVFIPHSRSHRWIDYYCFVLIFECVTCGSAFSRLFRICIIVSHIIYVTEQCLPLEQYVSDLYFGCHDYKNNE